MVISDVDCSDDEFIDAFTDDWAAAAVLHPHRDSARLRHRIEDIEVLVPFLLRELTSGADVRLAADVMRQLSKLPWPGNVAQLRRVVAETVARQRSGVIGADKLPPECRSLAKRKLTQIEALERDAIVPRLRGQCQQQAAGGDSVRDVAHDDLSQDVGLRHRLIRQTRIW